MSVFWIILTVCLLILCQLAVYDRLGLRRISYDRHFDKKRIYAGETAELIEVLENDKLLPIPWLRVESRVSPYLRFGKPENLEVSDERFHKSVFFLGPYKRITRRHRVTALRRGYYDLSLVSLTVGDLLGPVAKSRDFSCGAELLVYPRITPPEELPAEALRWQGEASVRRWTDPDPVLTTGVREYRPGDARRDINWKATARMDELFVNMRDYTVEPRLLILFNAQIRADLWGKMEPEQLEFLERGISLAAALAAWGTANGMAAGFRANSGSSLPGRELELATVEPDSGGVEAVLEELAVLKLEMRVGYARLLEAELDRGTSGLDILCVSAYWTDELEELTLRLRAHGNSVRHIPIGGGV